MPWPIAFMPILGALSVFVEPAQVQDSAAQTTAQKRVCKVHDRNRAAKARHELSLGEEADRAVNWSAFDSERFGQQSADEHHRLFDDAELPSSASNSRSCSDAA